MALDLPHPKTNIITTFEVTEDRFFTIINTDLHRIISSNALEYSTPLEALIQYFTSHTDIEINKLFILPSTDKFSIKGDGASITYYRKNGNLFLKEDRKIAFGSFSRSISSIKYTETGWKIQSGIFSWTILWQELWMIFEKIHQWNNYNRGQTNLPHKINLTVTQVSPKSR